MELILVYDFSLFKLSFSRRFLSKVFFDDGSFADRLFYSGRFVSLFNQRFFSLNMLPIIFSYVSNWDSMDFFFCGKVFNFFNVININKLKNLILKKVNCNKLWGEIFKIIEVGLINFSDFFILEKKFYLECSFISIFLLEIYLFELDLYLLDICFNLSSVKTLVYNNSNNLLSLPRQIKNMSFFNSYFFPNRVEKLLINSFSLKCLNYDQVNNLSKDFFLKVKNSLLFFFVRYFCYVRYKNYLVLGFKGSLNFFNFLRSKLTFFVRSNLNIDIDFTSISLETFFLGYKIKNNKKEFSYLNNSNRSNYISYSNKKVFVYLLLKLDKLRTKIDILVLKRLQSEILNHLNRFVLKSGKGLLDFRDKKFWISIFQFEVVRSSQICRLVNSDDSSYLWPNSQLDFIKFLKFDKYKKYMFNIYLYKCRKLISNVSLTLFPFISGSFYPVDFLLSISLLDLKKRLFLTQSISTNLSSTILSNQFINNNRFFSLGLDFNYTSSYVKLFVPFDYISARLRSLGFLHFKKCRPISNTKYLGLSDKSIIKTYGLLAYSFILWYRFSSNFQKIRVLTLLLRQSCFLTLCRKHNKSRAWASRVYTYNLVLSRGLFNTRSFFPSNFFIKKSHFFFLKKRFFLINEQFFLDFFN